MLLYLFGLGFCLLSRLSLSLFLCFFLGSFGSRLLFGSFRLLLGFLSRLFGFHQFANEESDGKTYNDSYYYFHLSLF